VKSASTTRYRYVPGADPARLVDLLRTGVLQPDDASFAPGTAGEDVVLASMAAGEWASLRVAPTAETGDVAPPRRRWFLQPIDMVRERMPVGDR
jgi:hypothetical protein